MHLTVFAFNDQLVNIEVDAETAVEDVKAILEAETQIPGPQQALVFGNRILKNNERLGAAGLKDGDVIQMMPAQQPRQQAAPAGGAAQGRGAPAPNAALATNADGSAVSPAAFCASLKANAEAMAGLRTQNPELFRAINEEDYAKLQEALRQLHKAKREHEEALRREQELLEADPFDLEAQRKIEELIQQKNIEENLMQAMEHSPEVFAQVEMLYVNMEVNGVPVKAFVDSGAQMSIMTMEFAEKCYISRLIDKRWQGMAVGVGQSKIIGRIHQAPLKVAGHFITSSITVLEQRDGPQFIFGLDNLKRHQCSINLKRNVLEFESCHAELPFLPDHEIPKDFKKHIEQVSQADAEKSMSEAVRDSTGGASGSQPAAPAPPPAAPAPFQAAAPAAPPAPQQQPQAAAGGMEAKVQQLMAMGFPREAVEQALRATGGNIEAAASVLTFGDAMFD